MKKNVIKTTVAAVCVVAAGMGGFKAYNAAAQSETDMLLAENVEALSLGEYNGGKRCNGCPRWIPSDRLKECAGYVRHETRSPSGYKNRDGKEEYAISYVLTTYAEIDWPPIQVYPGDPGYDYGYDSPDQVPGNFVCPPLPSGYYESPGSDDGTKIWK